MGLENTVLEVISTVQPQLYWLLLKLCIAAIIILVLKKILENVAAYLLFRWNKYLGNGVRVNINGQNGVIENYDKSSIYVKLCEGDVLVIPISRWRWQTWIVRSSDNEKDALNRVK